MPARRTARVVLEQVATDTGLWCFDCKLSTGARLWFTSTTGDHTCLRSQAVCTECGGRRIEASQ